MFFGPTNTAYASKADKHFRVQGPRRIDAHAWKKDGVETEGAGAEHAIRVIEADANSFRCEWFAKREGWSR